MKKRKDYISDLIYSMQNDGLDLNKYIFNLLTEKQMLIYKMRFDEQGNAKMSRKDIAKELGISTQAIDSSLNIIYKKINELSKYLKIDIDFNKKLERPIIKSDPTVISKHASELIQTIKKLKRLPKNKNDNNMISEAVFSDNGADQRGYYNHILSDVSIIKRKMKRNEELTYKEKQKIIDYKAIMEALNQYRPNYSETRICGLITDIEDKVYIFIDELNNELISKNGGFVSKYGEGKQFFDGVSQLDFYNSLKHVALTTKKNIDYGKYATKNNLKQLKLYNLIENVLSYYPIRLIDSQLLIYQLFFSLGIDYEKNKSISTKSYGEVYAKICFLLENNYPLVDSDGYINCIMFMADWNMKIEYNVTLEELAKKYIDGKVKSEDSFDVVKRLCKRN